MRAMPMTPGMVRAAESSTVSNDPPIVGARATTVGAAGMARSSAYLALPVTMSRASRRVVGRPIRVNLLGSFGAPETAGTATFAAAADNDP
jgi:hypothetical protein